MVYGIFLGSCLLGIAVAMAIFFPLGAKRRASIPPLVWWLCLIPGVVACFYGLSHSTAPSFAPRITAVGKLYDHVERRHGRDSYYGYRFVPDGGSPVNIETNIILPDWDSPAIFNGRIFRVVYLDSNERPLRNEAIDIAILSGKDAGFRDFVDARPFGDWLGIPVGAVLFAFGFLGLRYMGDDSNSKVSDDDD